MINQSRQHMSRISLGTKRIRAAARFLPGHVWRSDRKFGLLFAVVVREN